MKDRAGRERSHTRGVLRADKISPVAGARSEKETKIPLLLLAETGPGLGIQLRELSKQGDQGYNNNIETAASRGEDRISTTGRSSWVLSVSTFPLHQYSVIYCDKI